MNNTPENSHRSGKIENFYRRVLHILELGIAALVILVLAGKLLFEIYDLIFVTRALPDVTEFLHTVLTIVVGLEFVRMIIDLTPANTLEVLIMATARHIIISHESNLTLLAGIACIAALFAIRRFLIPRAELTQDLADLE